MALAREVDSLDGIDEKYHGFYAKQENGKYLWADLEDVGNLKGALKKERDGREFTEKELKAFKDLGLTAEQIRELKDSKGGEPKPPEDVEKLIAKRLAEKEKEWEPVRLERDALKAEVRTLKLTDKVRADFVAAGGIEADAELMLADPLTQHRFDLNDKGKIVVLDEDGDPTGMTPKEFFEKVYKGKRPKFFKGTGAGGSGASSGDGGSGTSKDLMDLPPAERLAAARERGLK